MKITTYSLVLLFSILFASQVLAHELLVLSGDKSQSSRKWIDEISAEYPKSEVGQKLPAKITTFSGANFPQWLNEAINESHIGEIIGTPTFIIWDVENKKELGRVEGYTQKANFYSQLNEALEMVKQGIHPGKREGSGGHTSEEGSGGDQRREGSEMSRDIMDHIYKTPEEAKRASKMLGFGGEIHTHETPEDTIYMPGPMM